MLWPRPSTGGSLYKVCMTMRSILCENINMHSTDANPIDIHLSDAGIQLA